MSHCHINKSEMFFLFPADVLDFFVSAGVESVRYKALSGLKVSAISQNNNVIDELII